ncbi:MAG: hypothetical protein AAF146_11325 [Bacteroidota bacterium]
MFRQVLYLILFLLPSGTLFAQDPCGGGDDRGDFGCSLLSFIGLKEEGDEFNIPRVHAVDPNEISGPIGYDTAQWVSINDDLGYTIFYENDPVFATAPAQIVEIRMPVEPDLNIFSVRLGEFGFGFFNFDVPENTTFYQNRLDVVDSLDVLVDVTAGIDVVSKEVFWIFESIDPLTGLPPEDALTGYLPVNDTTTLYNDTLPKRGEGYVTFTIQPKNTLLTGDTVTTQAAIIFDINAPLITNTWTNLVDAFGPVSQIDTVFQNGDDYRLIWSGVDDVGGVGIEYYELYVAQDAGPFLLYQSEIDTTVLEFPGVPGSTYAFYVRSIDHVGNREAEKTEADPYVTITNSIKVLAKVFLEGPYDGNTGLMRDLLRANDLLPTGEPFTALGFTHVDGGGNEVVSAAVFDTTGQDAIVDWVFLELRSPTQSDSVVATRAALVQADGDIVDLDGQSAVGFSGKAVGEYYLAIRHRNHLGVRTADRVMLNGTPGTLLDFTALGFNTFGIDAQTELAGVRALYSGNANHDSQVNAVDKNLYWRVQNGQTFDYLIFTADFNMDGAVNAVDKNLYWRINNSITQQLD